MRDMSEVTLARWTAPGCPFRVDYVLQVLDRIRLEAVTSFLSHPRGGPEIGGLLLGRNEMGRVVITGSLPFQCEHAFGPSFTLSERDQAQLAEAIAAAAATGHSQPVGWYHSHTRGEVALSEADLELHRRLFPKPWHLALVLKPRKFEPVTACFFLRGADGKIHTDASPGEFVLDALQGTPSAAAPLPSPAEPPPPIPLVKRPIQPPAVEVANAVRDSELKPETPPPPPPLPPPPLPPERKPQPEADAESPELAPVAAKPRRWPWWIGMAAAILIIAGVAASSYRNRNSRQRVPVAVRQEATVAPPDSIRLVTIDDNGQLQILWDPTHPVAQHSPGGTLQIKDGNESRTFDLEPAHLQTGSFTYRRQAERVDVRLTINRPSGAPLAQVTTYVGRRPDETRDLTNLRKQRDALANEAEQLKADLAKQVERTKQLEKSLAGLRGRSNSDRQPK